MLGGGTPPHQGKGLEMGHAAPSQEKMKFSLEWRVFVHFERYFCLCPRQKTVEFQHEVIIW